MKQAEEFARQQFPTPAPNRCLGCGGEGSKSCPDCGLVCWCGKKGCGKKASEVHKASCGNGQRDNGQRKKGEEDAVWEKALRERAYQNKEDIASSCSIA